MIYVKGSYWTGHHYFWIDLAITPGLRMLIVAVATGSAAALTRLLSSRPLESLGRISYSLYLIHLPILTVLAKKVAPHFVARGPHTYAFVVVVGLPLSLLAARLFASVFEIPSQRHRSWRALPAAAHRTPAAVPGAPAALRRPGFRSARPEVSPAASPDDRPDSMPERVPARGG